MPALKKANVRYNAEWALNVCELIAEGRTLTEALTLPGTPSKPTWYKWLSVYPELRKAYEGAREVSGMSLEDELLTMVGELRNRDLAMTKEMIARYNLAMQQLRWSAEKRDPRSYGTRQASQIVIPIQINTTLALKEGERPAEEANIYAIRAVLPAPTSAVEALELDSPEMITLDLEAEPSELPDFVKVPEKGSAVELNRTVRPPRRPKRHKTPAQIRATLAGRGNRGVKKSK